VNRRLSGAIDHQPRKKFISQNELKKISQKRPPQIKPPTKSVVNNQNKLGNKKRIPATGRFKVPELDLIPPSDSEEEWASCSRLEAYWRPLHGTNAPESTESHSVKAQAKVEFDNISKRIAKVRHKSKSRYLDHVTFIYYTGIR